MAEYKSIIDDKDYCDQSQLYMKEYKEYPTVLFEGQLEFINKWITDDTNAPLVIVGEAESGKKTLICSYIEQSKIANPHWLHLCLFSSINPEYSHIIYKIMIELRNHFKVEQKVDLNDEKLRRYFKYWLEVISDLIEKEYLGYVKAQIPKVVIVIEGIDEYYDNKGNKVETQFWLPHQIPKHIKLILSTKCVKADQLRGSTILQHHLPYDKKEKILQKLSERVKEFNHKYANSSLYLLQILNKMVKIKPNLQVECGNINGILENYISTVSNNIFSVEEIKSILYILTLSKKGLKSRWFLKIVNVSEQKWGLFLRFFSFLIVQEHNYYIICNKTAKVVIKQLVDPKGQKQKTYRQSISYSIRNEAVYLRELQEVVQQLYLSETYTELKEVISKVQNFAMLYNPFSKDLLCQCWYKLEQLQQYDPVFEYNKAVQAYKSHYYPKEEELYKIIFQISMFFKEYSEFENARTPQFRHPLIKGENDQLEGIGILEELKQLGMIGKSKVYKLKPLQKYSILKRNQLGHNNKKQKAIKQTVEEEPLKNEQKEEKYESKKSKREKVKQIQNESSDISRPQTSQSTIEKIEKVEPLLNIEELNVSITANQQKFRLHFTSSMKQYLENYFTPMRKGNLKDRQLSFQLQQSDLQEEILKDKVEKQYRFDLQKFKETLILKKFREYLEETYHKSGQQMRFYYYKQWIWLEFPWICQTVKNNYSQMIKQCIPGSIHFMSPNQEFKFVKQALKIARNAKQSKINIFTQKKIELLPLRYSPDRLQELNNLKKTNNNDKDKYYISRTKVSKDTLSVSKLKINLTTVDEMINKQRQNELFLKQKLRDQSKTLKGQSSLPNLNMFVTETTDKSVNIFPTLNKSKFALQKISNRRQKQNCDESRDCTMIIKKYNEIKHENDILVQKIDEMKKVSSIQMDKTKQQQQLVQNQIDHLIEKKQALEKNTANQSLLQKKLEVIIKICDLNKMYGSESQYLSTYLSSLKQMITIEDSKIKQIKSTISLITQTGKNQMKQLRQIRKTLKSIKQQHQLYLNLASDSTNQNYKALPLSQIQEQLKEMQLQIKSKSRKQKSRFQHLINTQTYDILQKLGLSYVQSDSQVSLQEFSYKVQKKKQLSLKNNDLLLQLRKMREENIAKKQHLKSIQEGSVNAKKLSVSNTLIQSKKMLAQIRQRSLLLQQSLKTLAQG